MTTRFLRLDPTAASFEDFGDEIVVIHNASGVFYSIKGRARVIWRALETGLDADALDERLRAIAPEEADTVKLMVAELESRGIAIPAIGSAALPADLGEAALGPAAFESNSDFDDLIRLDPIHDVDDRGWPHRKTDPH